MKTAIFSEAFNCKESNIETNFSRVGGNTGNLAFFRSIKKLFNTDFVKPYYGIQGISEKLEEYDNFITTDLIWITNNKRYENTEKIFRNIGNRALIPISVGLQSDDYSNDFVLHEDTERLLLEMAERCVIGVRGDYTAEILNKYGIKNIEIIGCPSLYYISNYSFSGVKEETLKVVCNFKSFWGKCSESDYKFLEFCRKNEFGFVEQTVHNIENYNVCEKELFNEWLSQNNNLFFDIDEWCRYMSDYNFCLGMRFHGNVLAI